MTRARSTEGRGRSGEGTPGCRQGWKGRGRVWVRAEEQNRSLQGPGADAAVDGKVQKPQPGGCRREGVAAASGALRTSRAEPGAGRGPGRALTVRSGAPRSSRCHRPRPRGAQPPQQQAAPPQPPRSILTPTRAPQPRATLRRRKWRRRRRARPTMLCAVTSPALAPPGGAQGKLRLGSAVGSSPRATDPLASDREALFIAPPPVEERKNARRPGPTLCGSLLATALDLQPGPKGRLASSGCSWASHNRLAPRLQA